MKILLTAALCAAALALSGCPIAGGAKYTVGGTVTGLSGSGLVLQLNGGDSLSFNGSGTFVFGTRLDNSAADRPDGDFIVSFACAVKVN